MRNPDYLSLLLGIILILANRPGNAQSIFEPVIQGNIEEVKTMLDRDSLFVNRRDAFERTPLLLACRECGNLEMVRLLVENGADINTRDAYGDTPLLLAAWRGFEDLVDYLLEQNASFLTTGAEAVELLSYATNKGLWRLYEAMNNKGGDAFIYILQEQPALHWAAAGDSHEIVNDLIDKQLPVNGRDVFGWTPLHYASYFGRLNTSEVLLENEADIDALTPLNESALFLALSEGKSGVADLLTAWGAKPDTDPEIELPGPYWGQKVPGKTPVLFAPGIVSRLKGGHSNITFSPDGNEAYWTEWNLRDIGYSDGCKVWYSRTENGKWLRPVRFLNKGDTPFISADGDRMYFLATLPVPPDSLYKKGIWYLQKAPGDDPEIHLLDSNLINAGLYWQFTLDNNRTLYFSTDEGLFRSECLHGVYGEKESLAVAMHPDYRGMGPYISPAGDYIIFSSRELPDTYGQMDLYIGFRKKDGTWTAPVNMGATVNSGQTEILPMVSPDGRYLFMRTERTGVSGIYWMSSTIIDELRTMANDSALTKNYLETRQVEWAIRNSIGWAKNKDFDLLYSVIADDTNYIEVDPDGSVIRGIHEFRKNEKIWGSPDFRAIRYEIRDLKITFSLLRDIAWFYCILDDINEWKGQPANWENVSWTGVLERRDDRWQIVQMHFSYPMH